MSIRLNAAAGLLAIAATGLLPAAARAQTKLLRFPDIAGDRVAFCYAGDIWTAPAEGRHATRLTAHPGLELFPHFSPDGKWIAFTGQYEGDEQVYVIPARGRPAEAADLLPGARPVPAARRLRQPGDGLDARRRRDPVPLAARRRRRALRGPAVHGARRRAARRRRCRCRPPAPATSRRTASGSPTRRCSATSAPGSATRAAGRRTSSFTTSPRTTRSRSRRASARSATRCGSATRIYFASDRDGTLNLYSWDPATDAVAKLTSSTVGTCAGRPPTTSRASSTSWAASCTSTTSPGAPTRRSRSSSRTTASPCGRRGSARRSTSRTSSSAPRASGRSSSPGATSSRCRSRRARPAT